MARQWDALSSAYRKRLERGGVTKSAYESGASLKAVRGHSRTPEHPEDARRKPLFYTDYLDKRRQIEDRVIEIKDRAYTDLFKFSGSRSREAVRKYRDTSKMISWLHAVDNGSFDVDNDIDRIDWQKDGDEYAFLYYH